MPRCACATACARKSCGTAASLTWRRLAPTRDFQEPQVKTKKVRTPAGNASSSEYFQNLRPKFLDWEPPTEEEKALEVKARQEARETELKRVTDLAKQRDVQKAA